MINHSFFVSLISGNFSTRYHHRFQRGTDTYVYAYNAANRMQSVTLNGVLQAEYEYNAQGQQVIRRVGGQTIHTVHDLDGNRIAEYDYDPTTQVSTLLREYIWMNGLPVAVVENGVVYYIRTDHIGRPVFATDGAGVKVWEASYLPFGGMHTSTGTNTDLRFPPHSRKLALTLLRQRANGSNPKAACFRTGCAIIGPI